MIYYLLTLAVAAQVDTVTSASCAAGENFCPEIQCCGVVSVKASCAVSCPVEPQCSSCCTLPNNTLVPTNWTGLYECNTCSCDSGRLGCTRMFCPEENPEEEADPEVCLIDDGVVVVGWTGSVGCRTCVCESSGLICDASSCDDISGDVVACPGMLEEDCDACLEVGLPCETEKDGATGRCSPQYTCSSDKAEAKKSVWHTLWAVFSVSAWVVAAMSMVAISVLVIRLCMTSNSKRPMDTDSVVTSNESDCEAPQVPVENEAQ